MLRRLLGTFLMIRALSPFILLAAFLIPSWLTVREITGAAARYGEAVEAQIDSARQTFERANAGFTALSGYFTAVKRVVDGVATDVRRLASAVDIPVINVRIEIPGVTQLKQVVAGVAAAGRAVGTEIGKITSLATVPAQLVDIREATRTFAADVRIAVVGWITLVVGVLALAVVVWILGALTHIASELQRGWALVRGA